MKKVTYSGIRKVIYLRVSPDQIGKMVVSSGLFLLSWLVVSCSLFSVVDPLPPSLSALELVDVNRSQITVKGVFEEPAGKNDRQNKKSGKIIEYGFVYGKTENLTIETGSVIKLDSAAENLPLTIERQISGLGADTDYFIASYARNEGGGIAYSERLKVTTTTAPQERFNRKSVKLARGDFYDLDNGVASSTTSAQADASIDIFNISGRGTVLSISALNGLIVKNMGVINYDELIYPALLKVRDYDPKGVSYIANAQTANTVIAFKTLEGRYGRWRIESVDINGLVMSVVTYNN